jgi:pilus assembly protein CpaF
MANLQAFERSEYQQVKADLHRKILDRLDLEKLGRSSGEAAREEVLVLIRNSVNSEAVPLSFAERERLSREILDEIFGLGPLEPLLKDPTVSDILVNRFDRVYVERAGKLEITGLSFKDNQHLMQIIDRIVSRIGRRVDESSPMVDARLQDGSRVNAIIPPLALDGACLSIRRFGRDPVTARNMIENKTLTDSMLELLSAMVKGRLNLLISGGTGAGKTTLLNVLSGYIPNSERIVTIEDAAELQLKQEHVVRLETRPPNIEGKGSVRMRQLVINSLRMRPDRIVVGEVRGEEAFDMLQAMNTGHEGSLTTVHANSPRDALNRVENMVSMANLNIPERAVRQQVASAIHAVVQIARLSDGSRKVLTVSEITGMDGDSITMQDIFVFERSGIDESGRVRGVFHGTGRPAYFAERLATAGCRLSPTLFESRLEV